MSEEPSINKVYHKYLKELALNYSEDEAQVIFYEIAQQVLKQPKHHILDYMVENHQISKEKNKKFDEFLDELKSGKPLQYVQGFTNFYGYEFKVSPNVLIPRPETEELVEWLLNEHSSKENLRILDVGTGSGVIAITLALKLKNASIDAVDISSKALEVSKKNAKNLDAYVNFIKDDFLNFNSQFYQNQYDIIISNPPYIKIDDYVDEQVFEYEPKEALYVSNENPLIFYDAISNFAQQHLDSKGEIYVEINQFLPEETKKEFQKYFKNVELKTDISGNERFIKASDKL